jgi:hypothetical protein
MVDGEPALVSGGRLSRIMDAWSVAVQELDVLVTVKVYTPATDNPVGLCAEEVNPPGPVQLYVKLTPVLEPLPSRLTVETRQVIYWSAPAFDNGTAGSELTVT